MYICRVLASRVLNGLLIALKCEVLRVGIVGYDDQFALSRGIIFGGSSRKSATWMSEDACFWAGAYEAEGNKL